MYMITKLLARLPFRKKTTWGERHFLLIVIASALFAMIISMGIGMQQSVWFDEAYSIMLAKQPLDQLLYLTSIDTHPPLYYVLLKAWAAVFGWSEFALRSLSILALGGAVVVAGVFVRRVFDARIALAVLPFLVVAPFLLRYGFEIRMYALAGLIGIAATYVLVRALQAKNSRQRWISYGLYAVLVAVGVYTLYYMALLWIAHVVWLVWLWLKEKRSLFHAPWLLAYVGSVVLFLPWLPTFFKQVNNGALAPIAQPLTVENILGIVSFNFFYQPTWQLSPLNSLILVFVVAAIAYFSINAFKYVTEKQRPYLILLALYMSIPIIILAIVSLLRPMYVERYLAHVTIGGILFIGLAIATVVCKKMSKPVWVTAGALFIVLLFGMLHVIQTGNYNFQRSQTPAVKQAAATVNSCDNQTAVVAGDPYVAIELAYYLPQCKIYFYSDFAELSGGYAPLSNSPLRLTNPAKLPNSIQDIIYIYDNQFDLRFANGHKQVSERIFDNLIVKKFSAE